MQRRHPVYFTCPSVLPCRASPILPFYPHPRPSSTLFFFASIRALLISLCVCCLFHVPHCTQPLFHVPSPGPKKGSWLLEPAQNGDVPIGLFMLLIPAAHRLPKPFMVRPSCSLAPRIGRGRAYAFFSFGYALRKTRRNMIPNSRMTQATHNAGGGKKHSKAYLCSHVQKLKASKFCM